LTLLSGNYILSYGQKTNNETDLKSLTKLDLGLQGLGLTFEPRIGRTVTTEFSAGVGGGYSIGDESFDYEWQIFNPAFYFSATPKFFYNRQKRIEKGKSVKLNSGNYFGLRVKYTTESIDPQPNIRESLLINLHWGLQRSISNRFSLNAHIGAGYAQDLNSQIGTIYPAADFKISYNFVKSKNG
jgi:hypothetical protein